MFLALRRARGGLLAVALAVGFQATPAQTVAQARVSNGSSLAVDHSLWTDLLDRFVVVQAGRSNRFDYAGLGQAERDQLSAYLDYLAAIDVTGLASEQQLAYWLNLHNALVVSLISDNYPIASLTELEKVQPDVWTKGRLQLGNDELSVSDAQSLLRSQWPGPDVHYGMACGARSCPGLLDEAFDGERISSQLELSARAFINGSGVRASSRGLAVSEIFRTYAEDFGATEGAVLAHMRQYSEPKLAEAINNFRSIKRYKFDSRLNAAN